MKGSTAKKIMSVFIIGLMLASGFSVLASLGDAGNTVPVSQVSADTPSSVSAHTAELKENAWLNKIDPSMREAALQQSKAMVDITVLTTNAGLLNRYMRGSGMDPDVGHRSVAVRSSSSSVPVTKTLTVPYAQLKEISSLPGVIGVYQTEKPKPAVIDNSMFSLGNPGSPMPSLHSTGTTPESYPTADEHHAMDAWSKGYDGTGVNIAVVDTGIDFATPDLMGQWAVDMNTSSPYYGWPVMWDPTSMDLMDSYFTSNQDNILFGGRMPYPFFASYGESSWYSDTSYATTADHNTTTGNYTVTYEKFGGQGYPNKRVDPNGYGGLNMSYIDRTYYIGNDTNHIVSQSGIYHIGIAKDDYLTSIWGTRVAMLVVDSTTPGVYDTVYVDLDNDGDFTDEKPVNQSSPLCYTEKDQYIGGWTDHIGDDANASNWTYRWQGGAWADGVPDISGGLLYFMSNTQGSVTGEVLNVTGSSAKLAHGDIVTDIGPWYSLDITDELYINTSDVNTPQFMPSYSDTIYQDIVTDGTGVTSGSSYALNDTSYVFYGLGLPGNSVNVSYLTSLGYGIRGLTLYYGNDTDEYEMTESNSPGLLNYKFDTKTNTITLGFDMENGSYIYALYNMDTYSMDFNTGEITFLTAPPADANITADYQYGLPVPYSDVYSERMGYDNFIPASGDMVAFFGDFDIDTGFPHGTFCASNAVGTMANFAMGTAPGAKIVGVGDFYNAPGYDSWYFAVEGYDGNVSTSDDGAVIVSNSFGGGTVNTGWSYSSRLVYDITTEYAPNSVFVVSAGNEGFGYGTVGNPGASPGVVTVGAGVNMAYRWLLGYDGNAAAGGSDWQNYFHPDSSWYGDVASFSSKGPTALGTPDPDVLAVGEFGVGACPVNAVITGYGVRDPGAPDGTNAVDLWSGTSMAAPVTAGVMALIYQAYHDNHNNTWPNNRDAQNILTSSCDDHNYDVLEQGAGWLNASRAVDMAADMTGVSADRMYWVPGGYHGVSHEASINLLRPGESDTTVLNLTNHDGSAPATVSVSDAIYNRTSEYTFELPTYFAGQEVLKSDGLYAADGATLLNGSLWNTAEWNNADFIKITAYTTDTTAYPYMNLFDWIDRDDHDGGNETAFNSEIIPVVNQTVITGHNGESYAYIKPPVNDTNNISLLAGSPVLVYSNGTLLDNSTGGNYTIDFSNGKITFLNDTGAVRNLNPGEVINITYTIYVTVHKGDSHFTSEAPVTSYTVWLNDTLNGTGVDWTSSEGTNFTFDAATGNLTLLVNLTAGQKVTIQYTWGHPGVYDGGSERIRMNVDLEHANLVTSTIYNPGERVDDGLVITMYDVNSIFLGAEPKLYDFTVSVEFYNKVDWSWLNESASSVNIPAGGSATVNITASVPADAGVGSYQGAVVLNSGGQISIIPVLINVPATTFPVHFGGNMPTTTLYDNGAMQGIHGGEYTGGGDWRFFFADVSGLNVTNARKLLSMLYWNGAGDDSEIYLMAAQADPYGFKGGAYGDFTMNKIAATKEYPTATDTLIPGSEILHTDMTDGPFEIAVRNWGLTGDVPYSEFHGDLGYMSVSPNTLDIYTSDTKGSVPVTAYSNIDLLGGIGSAVTYSKTQSWNAQSVDPYPYPGGSYETYLVNAPNQIVLTIPAQTVSATFTLYFYNGANDVDMGVYYDANNDGIAEESELIIPDTQTATSNNPEVGSLMFPPAGTYIIKVAGYDVAPGSLYDLTVKTLGIGESAFSAVNAANTTVPAGTPSTFDVGWDFGNNAPTDTVKTLMLVSPGAAPYALVLPIDITLHYDANAPTMSSPTPASGEVLQSVSLISVNFEDSSPINTKLSTMCIDGIDVSSQLQFTGSMVVYNARGLGDGMHTVSVKLVDAVGNIGTYSWGFVVDSTAPMLSVDSPAVTSANTVTITGTTEPTATVTVNGNPVSVGADGTFAYDVSITSAQTIVDVIATDLAGNSAEVTRTIVMDDTAPGLMVVVPTIVSDSTAVVSGTVTGLDNEVGPVSVTVNGVPVAVNSDGTFAMPVNLLEGVNIFTIVVTDAAGNSYSVQKSITLDSRAPGLSASVPSTTTSSSVTITGTATDASKVFVNGKQVMMASDGTFTATISVSPGSNLVVINAVDAAGNSVEQTYTVSYTPADLIPVVSASAPSQSAPTLTSAGGILAAVLFIIGLILGFIAKMFMGGGKSGEDGGVTPAEFYPEEEPVGAMGGMPVDTIEEAPAPEPVAEPVEEGTAPEVPSEEETPAEAEPVEEAPAEEETSEEAGVDEEEEEKGEVLDLTDI